MLTPLPAAAWDLANAAHLLNRAGFGGTPAEIARLHELGLDGAVDHLLNASAEPLQAAENSYAEPVDLLAQRQKIRALRSEPAPEQKAQRRALRKEQNSELRDLRFAWLTRMGETPAPLAEKMTLFWHGHFATSAQKVRVAHLMWQQNETLRGHALSNFTTLLKAVSRDPAMMIYLDLQQSKKQHPNENWAREVMELFTLGIGHYTEEDVREGARAFTGYRIDLRTGRFRFLEREHDDGAKNFLGHSGHLSGDDALAIIASQPACAAFIGRKLWRFFAEDEPSAAAVEAVADALRRHDYELRPVLGEMFRAREFYASKGRQIKSPVQFLVQSCRLLEAPLPSAPASDGALRSMGQLLLAPPNVKGWDGGKAWITTATLLFRYNFADYLINGTAAHPDAPAPLRREPIAVAEIAPPDLRQDPKRLIDALAQRLYQRAATARETETLLAYLKTREASPSDESVRHLLRLMMSTPQYQLT